MSSRPGDFLEPIARCLSWGGLTPGLREADCAELAKRAGETQLGAACAGSAMLELAG